MSPIFVASLVVACSQPGLQFQEVIDEVEDTGEPGEGSVDLSEEVYGATHLIEVTIEMDPADFEVLRHQERNMLELLAGEECMDEPPESPYTWFDADVEIDGTRIEDIAVRKKGLLGSVIPERPSLKLDFNRNVEDQEYKSLSRLTLNNGRQDPSRLKSCLGYAYYEAAGVPASRCSFAHVTVNGEDLGVYANVEPIKKPMLRRNFSSDEGALYEGTLSDFREGWTPSFQPKEGDTNLEELDAVVEALDVDPDEVVVSLDQVVAVDDFVRAWVADGVIGHWDSYPGNTNNFYVYKDPADERFRFIPWGIDAVFQGDEPFGSGSPVSVVTGSELAVKLWESDAGQAAYAAEVDRQMSEAWDTEAQLAWLADMDALTEPGRLWDYRAEHDDTLAAIEDFVAGREDALAQEWAGSGPSPSDTRRPQQCLNEAGSISIAFETTWGSLSTATWSAGSGRWSTELESGPLPVDFVSASVGEVDEGSSILLIAGELEDGALVVFYGLFETELFSEPGEVDIDWNEMTAYLLYDGDGDFADWVTWAYLGHGPLVLSESGTGNGDALVGELEVQVYGG